MESIRQLYGSSEHVESTSGRAKEMGNGQILKMCEASNVPPREFMREVGFAKKASKHRIGPRVSAFGFHDQIGFMRMERLDTSLSQLITADRLTNKHVDSLKKVLKTMWKRTAFVHMDLHGDNVWFTKRAEARLIDFGRAVSRETLRDCSQRAPYVLHADYDEPSIVDGPSALVNSCFDLFDRIDAALCTSKRRATLVRLKRLLQGEWMQNPKE